MELRSEILIDASPDEVWAVLSEVDRYHEWNPLIARLSGPLKRGAALSVVLSPPESRDVTFQATVLEFDDGRSLRFRGSRGAGFLWSVEHFFTLDSTTVEPTANDPTANDDARVTTRFSQGQNLTGLLPRYQKGQLTAAARGLVFMNQALKRRVEARKNALAPNAF